MFKPGDRVKIIKDHSSWFDTREKIQKGHLNVGSTYIVHRYTDDYSESGNPGPCVELEYGEYSSSLWWVGADCVKLVRDKSGKPSWL
jgi:hypothetical protein